jgi:hypothetical protein
MSQNSELKDPLQKRLKIVYTALSRRNRWFTGLSLKKYLKQNIFNLSSSFNNTAISSGRWSSYCHYSLVKSFQNMLDKNEITQGSKVLIHPLLPKTLVQEILGRGCQIFSFDISKDSLNFKHQEFLQYIQETNFDLVIHYGFNGLYEELLEFALKAREKAVPSLFIIDNFEIDLSLLELFEKHTLGGVIWSFGDSFWDNQLNEVLKKDLPTKKWFVSWQLETRTRSILEYHLADSQTNYIPILESYFYLLLNQYPFLDFYKIYYNLYKVLILKKSLKSDKQAVSILTENYQKIFNSAIPDLVFDLQLAKPVGFEDIDLPNQLIQSAAGIQQESKKIYNYFLEAVKKRPEGSLEVPTFFLDKSYLKYFIYTTEAEFWHNNLSSKGIEIFQLDFLDPFLEKMPHLENAKFVTEYGLFVDIFSSIDKDFPDLNIENPLDLNENNADSQEKLVIQNLESSKK